MEGGRRFTDRREAGKALATALANMAGREDLLVLALPRGGAPVGYEVARALAAPLDVFVVRKLGLPGHEELAMGAIAGGGVRVLNDDIVGPLHVRRDTIDRVAAAEEIELRRREKTYRGDCPPLAVRGRTVILVDDGLATGSTMRAAVTALRQHAPAALIVAVPVAAKETCAALREHADRVVCVFTPDSFSAVGLCYDDFTQVTDEQVRDLLARRRDESASTGTSA